MSSLSDLTPGMIGFGPIHGAAGALVNVGQLMLGEGFRVGRLDIRHVFVVTEPLTGGDVGVVEAMPSGARHVWADGRWTPEYAYVCLPEDYPGQAADAAAIARAMVGTPYSFASYAALAAWRFGFLRGKYLPDGTYQPSKLEAWIDRRGDEQTRWGTGSGQASFMPKEMICSVLADQAWALTGKQVMPKGTPHQCVTPGALAAALLEMPGAQWVWPS
jgi:hypothetical protein